MTAAQADETRSLDLRTRRSSNPVSPSGSEAQPSTEKALDDTQPEKSVELPSEPPELGPGATIGRFIVLGRQGEGGMGTVYEAFDRTLDRRVAVKVLRRDLESSHATRLIREAKALAQLSHPHVVQVYEVGEFDGGAFVAMELVQGRTLRQWCRQTPRPSWRECVDAYAQAGAGLAAAHERGLVHRDFKPSNVVMDDKGRVRVLDFGLARVATEPRLREDDQEARPTLTELEPDVGPGIDTLVTDTGLVMGTPGYMPPEQMQGEDVDARSDQFSFCVSLFEAVYGVRPYPGRSLDRLGAAMRQRVMVEVPADREVPTPLHDLLVRGLEPDPTERWPTMEALLEHLRRFIAHQRGGLEVAAAEWDRLGRPRAALWSAVQLDEVSTREREPLAPLEVEFLAASRHAQARGRRLRRMAAVVIPLALVAAYGVLRLQARAALRDRVDGHVQQAEAELSAAQDRLELYLSSYRRAVEHYDAGEDEQAREVWSSARNEAQAADRRLAAATREFERALTLDPGRDDARARMGDALLRRAELAEKRHDAGKVDELLDRLALYDRGGARLARWRSPATLTIETRPPGAALTLVEYRRDRSGVRVPTEPRALGDGPQTVELPPGSYRVRIEAEGRSPVLAPVRLERSEAYTLSVEVAALADVPPGFVYVPAGRFLEGSGDEALFDVLYDSVPIHTVTTDAFFIARNEVTFGEWIEFLESMPEPRRRALTPALEQSFVPVELRYDEGGGWELVFARERAEARARFGEPLTFEGRTRRRSQDWRRMPVLGISFEHAQAYLAWLDRSGRLPGARLCDDREWERAARGADERLYPHGDHLEPDDANVDVTYGRVPGTSGPDEVGSHPRSRSPFGVDDMIGNAGEWTTDPRHGDRPALRGSSFFMDAISAHIFMHAVVPSEFVDGTVGMRVCAPYPLPRPLGEPRGGR